MNIEYELNHFNNLSLYIFSILRLFNNLMILLYVICGPQDDL